LEGVLSFLFFGLKNIGINEGEFLLKYFLVFFLIPPELSVIPRKFSSAQDEDANINEALNIISPAFGYLAM
jgi:hypothetical protein